MTTTMIVYAALYIGMSFFISALANWHYFLKHRENTARKWLLVFLGGFPASCILPCSAAGILGFLHRRFFSHVGKICLYFVMVAVISIVYILTIHIYAKLLGIRHRIPVLILYSSMTLVTNITNTMLPHMTSPKFVVLTILMNYLFLSICYLVKHRDFEEFIQNLEHLDKVNTRMHSIMIYMMTILTYMYGIGVIMFRSVHKMNKWDSLQLGIAANALLALMITFALIKTVLRQANGTIENRRLYRASKEATRHAIETQAQMLDSQEKVIEAFANILENKSPENGGHVRRVALYSEILAKEIGLSAEKAKTIRIASMMHDVGKILIPNEILEKKGSFSDDEYAIMKQHVLYADQILKAARGSILDTARNIAREHHEHWDGKGYLLGLKGDEISIEAQIVAVADVFDALTSRRSYKHAWDIREAFAEILNGRGTQFSPRVVDAFMRSAVQFRRIQANMPDKTPSAVDSP